MKQQTEVPYEFKEEIEFLKKCKKAFFDVFIVDKNEEKPATVEHKEKPVVDKKVLDKKFQNWYAELGAEYKISPRVLKYIRCVYKERYTGIFYKIAIVKMRREKEMHLVEQMRTYRQLKINYAALALKEVHGLRESQGIISHLE